jgi:ATP-dependent RNA/DNA helicase IGHMBP2
VPPKQYFFNFVHCSHRLPISSMPHPLFAKLTHLLALEAEEEAARMIAATRTNTASGGEKRGNCLIRLAIRDERPALGGRVLLTLGKRDQTQSLPWHRFHVGTPVLLTEEQSPHAKGWRGVVCGRDAKTIEIAVNVSPETEQDRPTFRLDVASDEISRDRQRTALTRVAHCERGRLAQLRDVLLGERPVQSDVAKPWQPLDSSLNASQIAAISGALQARDLAIIHGPPGTGKTTTVIELIRQAVARGEKVLAVAASNLAVDNLLERLLRTQCKAVRLGHPARVLPELRAHTLDLLVENHPEVAIARKLIRDAYALRDRAARFTRAKPAPGQRQEQRQEAKEMLADARRIEQNVLEHYLDSADVLCATLTGIDAELLGERTFDLVVIDEAAQAIEPACWIPLLRAQRVVLAGDHCQLPPTILSQQAARDGLSTSLMERLMQFRETPFAYLLTVQYRMHSAIMEFSSQQFYKGQLTPHASVREHLLHTLPDVVEQDLTLVPLKFIDTAGASYDEQQDDEGESRCNPAEAELVAKQVEQLLAAGVAPRDLAIISPYAAQVRLLRERLAMDELEIDTVDGFQGREKEAVILSLVRSNTRNEIGFLADVRRMNVALTRARRHLLVIGDSATLGGHPFYAELLRYFESQAAYSTVWEYM